MTRMCKKDCESWTKYYHKRCSTLSKSCRNPDYEKMYKLRPDYEIANCFTAMEDVKKTYCEKNRNDQKLVLFCADVLPSTTPKPTTTTLAATTVTPDCSAAYLVAIGGCMLCCFFACVIIVFISRHQSKKYQAQAQASVQNVEAGGVVSKGVTTKGTTAGSTGTIGTTGTTKTTGTTGTTTTGTKHKKKKNKKKQ